MTGEDILECVQSSKSIIDTDSDGENAYPVLKSSEMRNIMKKDCHGCSDVVPSGRPIFDDFFQHLWPYIGNNTANVVFQMVKCLWLIRIDQ
ncbi:hypothetical protein TNCV_381491 [Trichonephila clavipes]|uniref:Uncharacterized protein n=1 Tax=Trichonephila clavipes TaxID=2585209 RepID=A0A8X6VJL1_TRICX|nr:hypothetical protein TNCV_381491 [Trichonephila clavipes]